jgi:hypothetical protein
MGVDMQQNESIKVTGDVKITITGIDGSREVRELKNLVVTNGKTLLCSLLAGVVAQFVRYIAFGTGATAPVVGNTALEAFVLSKAVTVTYPAANQVKFAAEMTTSEGNGNTFQEIGLYCATDNNMFSRLVIASISKTVAYRIQVEWVISFQ